MVDKVDIFNMALGTYLGGRYVSSVKEDTAPARACNTHYPFALQALLSMYDWSFADAMAKLPAESTNDRSDVWTYKYQMPGDAVRIHWVNDAVSAINAIQMGLDPDTKKQLAQPHIYSDIEGASVGYTRDIKDEDINIFHHPFSEALAAELASRVAIPITQKTNLAQYAKDQAEYKLGEAISFDVSMKPLQKMPPSDALIARGITVA